MSEGEGLVTHLQVKCFPQAAREPSIGSDFATLFSHLRVAPARFLDCARLWSLKGSRMSRFLSKLH